ncbi:MAG: cobalt transporter [Acidimicrobiia bacterium]|nr:cobalt transporter [Acidimicrobiia bacterium]
MVTDISRPVAVRRARWLNAATIGWNTVEGIVAIAAGVAAGSVSLIGFGLDSAIEVSAATALTWRLSREKRDDCREDDDRVAQRLVAVSFALLAAYVSVNAFADLVGGRAPDGSVVGVALAAVSLAVMPVIARAKRKVAPAIGSQAAMAEATQTDLCTALSAALLLGLGLNLALGWWWADPVAALVIATIAGYAAITTWRAPSLAHTCCG